jgi:hypothetical protein
MIGEPNTNDSAAKLPVAATTTSTCDGACLRASLIVATASPPPRAISGLSGPITSPRPIEARPARMIPGSVIGCVGPPPTLRPSAAMCPPFPGNRTIANEVISPAIAKIGSDHHSGGPLW